MKQPSATFNVVGQEAAVVPTKGSVVRRGAHIGDLLDAMEMSLTAKARSYVPTAAKVEAVFLPGLDLRDMFNPPARARSTRTLVMTYNEDDEEEPETFVRALQCAYAATFTPWSDELPARVLSSLVYEL